MTNPEKRSNESLAQEIISKCPEECFSNNSYREWRRSKEVLMVHLTKALSSKESEIEALKEELLKKVDPPKGNSYGWEQAAHVWMLEVKDLRTQLAQVKEENNQLKKDCQWTLAGVGLDRGKLIEKVSSLKSRLEKAEAQLEDWRDSYNSTYRLMTDEVHCSCAVLMKMKLEKAEAVVAAARDIYDNDDVFINYESGSAHGDAVEGRDKKLRKTLDAYDAHQSHDKQEEGEGL
jgi:hypothetical protein